METYEKVLTIIDVGRRLFLPDGCLPASPRSEECHGIELQVKDDGGNLWNFGCMRRSWDKRKLVIGSGWLQFVRSKELHSGDIVIFHREDDIFTGAHYKIEVKRSDNSSSVHKKEV
ncbi:hypothetical protein DITRI_Ditri01bG0056300 [Diplodiscus trichospermus]